MKQVELVFTKQKAVPQKEVKQQKEILETKQQQREDKQQKEVQQKEVEKMLEEEITLKESESEGSLDSSFESSDMEEVDCTKGINQIVPNLTT